MAIKGLHTDEERATVLALQMQGLGPSEISRRSLVPLRTVERWCESWRDVAVEQRDERLLTQATELALRYGALQHQVADALEELPPNELVKHGNTINNAMGTNVDKVLALTQRSPGQGSQAFVQIIFQGNQDPADSTPTFEDNTLDIEAPGT